MLSNFMFENSKFISLYEYSFKELKLNNNNFINIKAIGFFCWVKMSQKTFSIPDFVVFGLVLVISAGIGFLSAILNRKKQSTADFLLGGRNLSVIKQLNLLIKKSLKFIITDIVLRYFLLLCPFWLALLQQ